MESSQEEATTNFSVHYVLGGGAGDVKQVPAEQRVLQVAPRVSLGVTRDLYSSLLYIFAVFRKSSKRWLYSTTYVSFSYNIFVFALLKFYMSP
jgi:hypothetical protein